MTEGSHTLSIRFLNDYYDPTTRQDRNLFIYRVTCRSMFQPEEDI
ncbi:MAG: carbohydrate-binding domain-containing protein [Armatimonadota bacterium]